MNRTQISFLGAGNIAEAIITGLIKSDRDFRTRIIASDIRRRRLTFLSHRFGIRTADNNVRAVRDSDIVVLAVKPQQITGLLAELSGKVLTSQMVISVAAGISTAYIEKFLERIPVIRAMPNTPVLAGRGMIVICRGAFAAKKHEETAAELFRAAGKVIALSEKHFDAVTAISGSGPAYVFYLAEAMEKAAMKSGIDKKTARTLVNQTIAGSGDLMMESAQDPDVLRYGVTSPGGTTESAVKYLEQKRFIAIMQEAIERAKKRSKELTR